MRDCGASHLHRSVAVLIAAAIASAGIVLAQAEATPEFADRAAAARPAPKFNMFPDAKCGGKITVRPVQGCRRSRCRVRA